MTRTITTSITVYQFDELSETAQVKAVEQIRERLSGAWWDSFDNERITETMRSALAERLDTPGHAQAPAGMEFVIPDVEIQEWCLDGGPSISVKGSLTRHNAPALPWSAGIGAVELEPASRHTRVWVHEATEEDAVDGPGTAAPTDEQCDALKQAVRDALQAALVAGQAEMDYMTSAERAREAIEANGWEFEVDGRFLHA